jgi:hypothetical protein
MSEERPSKRVRKRIPKIATSSDLEALWEEHGMEAIETVRKHDTGAWLIAMARLAADCGEDDD